RCGVLVPFAEAVAELMPDARVEGRRSFPHLLCMVQASALLYHRQRARTPAGDVIATLDDYAVVVALGASPLSVARGGLGDGSREFVRALRVKYNDFPFTSRDAERVGRGSRSTIR